MNAILNKAAMAVLVCDDYQYEYDYSFSFEWQDESFSVLRTNTGTCSDPITGMRRQWIHCKPPSDRIRTVCVQCKAHADGFLISIRKVVILMPTIDMAATGANIKALIKAKGLKIGDIQNGCAAMQCLPSTIW